MHLLDSRLFLPLHKNAQPYGDVRFELQGKQITYQFVHMHVFLALSDLFVLALQDGGMVAPSGIAIEKMGDVNEDMVVVCASVTVGH